MSALTVTAPVGAPPRAGGAWRRAWLGALSLWAIAFATYLLLNAVYWTISARRPPHWTGLLDVWNRWDTGHYTYIATYGYNLSTENTAFFPLYPALIRLADPVLPGHELGAAMVVSSVCCVVALAFVHRLVEDLSGAAAAGRTSLYLMASPFAFYLVAAYNESLLLALCAASLYCMRRGHWWVAGAVAGMASGARQAGLLLAVAFVVEYLRQLGWRPWRLRWDALAVLLTPAGLVAFMIYCYYAFGDPLRFVHIQAHWGRELDWPGVGLLETWDHVVGWAQRDGPLSTYAVLNAIDLLTTLLVLALLVLCAVGPWRLGPESAYLVVFGAAIWLMVILAPMGHGLPPLHGVPRYALEIVPIYVLLGRLGEHRWFERAYLFPAIALQAALLLAYFGNVWLA